MKLVVVAVILLSTAIANASTALVIATGKTPDAASAMLEDWKNEKSLGDKLFTSGNPELSGNDLVIGVCEKPDADAVLPLLQVLYPGATAKVVESGATTCPKLVSQPTKVVAKHSDKSGNVTLTVALLEGVWDKGETTQIAVGNVRDKDNTIIDTYFQRAGTVLGGETCRADLKVVGKVVTINRRCEGIKDVETKKLSVAKGRLKIE